MNRHRLASAAEGEVVLPFIRAASATAGAAVPGEPPGSDAYDAIVHGVEAQIASLRSDVLAVLTASQGHMRPREYFPFRPKSSRPVVIRITDRTRRAFSFIPEAEEHI